MLIKNYVTKTLIYGQNDLNQVHAQLCDIIVKPMKEEDNQNMNSRVQQLYMQLLHEIVKKKDETLETQSLEKKLLNQTVHLYELEVTLWEMKERFE